MFRLSYNFMQRHNAVLNILEMLCHTSPSRSPFLLAVVEKPNIIPVVTGNTRMVTVPVSHLSARMIAR